MTEKITYEDLRLPNYLNGRIVGTVGGTLLTITDAIDAALLAKNNVFVGGKRGSGKSQLLFDIRDSRYGGKGMVVEGRADLKADEVFKHTNMRKLHDALRDGTIESSQEIIELAQAVGYRFFGVDEINRLPEVTQNELLSPMNGYVLHQGNPVPLGDGFCVGLATGNLGNGEYVGTFKLDGALADRLHLFLNLDFWKPTDEDMAIIDVRRLADPRIKRVAEPCDISDRIVAAQRDIAAQEYPVEMLLIGRYLERSLDYCSKFPSAEHSKDNLGPAWPVICTQKACDLREKLCGSVKAVGERTVQATKRLALGLQYVAQLKDASTKDDPMNAMLTAVQLLLPYSGVISPAYLRKEGIFNNPDLAAKELMGELRSDIHTEFGNTDQPGPLLTSLAYAMKGKLAERPYEPSKAHWKFAQSFLRELNASQGAR